MVKLEGREKIMTTSQIILYAGLALIALVYFRRFMVTRTVPRYTAAQLTDRIKDPAIVLLDVRSAREREAQNISGSLHIPLQELTRRLGDLEKYKNREVVCYCQSGNRSLVAAMRLRRLGFNASSLDGGIAEWMFTTQTRSGR
jgi:rhodanese-related sulfurtransferase